MTKSTITALISLLNGETIDNADAIREELTAELNKNAVRAQAKDALYAQAREVAVAALSELSVPVTISELYEEIKDNLPEGFTKGQLQYGMTRLWKDAIVKGDCGYVAA